MVTTFLQVFLLMLGPIYQQVDDLIKPPTMDIIFARTVFVAPFFEELVFRQFFLLILSRAGLSNFGTSIIGPTLFAIAHVHHHIGKQSILSIMGEVTHTCIFGWLGFYFLIHRTFWDSVLAHAVCNYIGLPDSKLITRKIAYIYSVGLLGFIVSI